MSSFASSFRFSSSRTSSFRSSIRLSSSAATSYPYEFCGDGIQQSREQCDRGSLNGQPGSDCSITCQRVIIPDCGDGELNDGEECDDGNVRDNDGCNNLCKMERTYCAGDDCTVQAYCGDGILQSATGEQCDDGNRVHNDDCGNDCKWTRLPECGDGILQPDYEQCDQGPYNGDYSGSPCHANCTLPYCGDGWQDANEECDDGNNLGTDGCSAVCTVARPSAAIPGRPALEGNVGFRQDAASAPDVSHIPTPARTPTGPGLAIFLASGAAAGIGIVRRRLRGSI